jgi:hypothetical protein
LNIENTGRRFWTGGGELHGTGDDGELDRGGSSEKTAGESFGLEGGVELPRSRDEVLTAGAASSDAKVVVSVL